MFFFFKKNHILNFHCQAIAMVCLQEGGGQEERIHTKPFCRPNHCLNKCELLKCGKTKTSAAGLHVVNHNFGISISLIVFLTVSKLSNCT